MSTKSYYSIPVMAAALLFSACSGGEEKDKDQQEVTVQEEDGAVSEDLDFVLPQPISLAHAFKNAGLNYVAGKTNPVSKKDTYSKKIDQLLNLGVYSTDLAYCAINNKTQEAREYLTAVQSLGSKVGLESIFSDKALIEQFDKSLGNQEAMEDLIYDLQDKSDAFLQDNDLRYLAAVEFAGAWAEGMYLGIDDTRKNRAAMTVAIVDQMTLLRNTIRGLEGHPSQDARLKEVVQLFRDVSNTYDGFASVKAANKNKNFTAPVLTVDEFNTLADKIVALRSGIVSPSK